MAVRGRFAMARLNLNLGGLGRGWSLGRSYWVSGWFEGVKETLIDSSHDRVFWGCWGSASGVDSYLRSVGWGLQPQWVVEGTWLVEGTLLAWPGCARQRPQLSLPGLHHSG